MIRYSSWRLIPRSMRLLPLRASGPVLGCLVGGGMVGWLLRMLLRGGTALGRLAGSRRLLRVPGGPVGFGILGSMVASLSTW